MNLLVASTSANHKNANSIRQKNEISLPLIGWDHVTCRMFLSLFRRSPETFMCLSVCAVRSTHSCCRGLLELICIKMLNAHVKNHYNNPMAHMPRCNFVPHFVGHLGFNFIENAAAIRLLARLTHAEYLLSKWQTNRAPITSKYLITIISIHK